MARLTATQIHRCGLIGDIIDTDWQSAVARNGGIPQPHRALLVGAEPRVASALRTMTSAEIELTPIEGLDATPAADARCDVLLFVGELDDRRLDRVRHSLSPDGLLIVDVEQPGHRADLLALLRSRFAVVLELAQTTVHGSAITSVTQGPGLPRISTLEPGSDRPSRGAPQEHTILLAADRSLASYPSQSAMHAPARRRNPSRTNPVAHAARRLAGRLRRRLRGGPPPLQMPCHQDPELSIVIPVHGKWSLTEQCLAAVEALAMRTPAEVIVVDDASPDDTRHRLAGVAGVRVVELDENVGFLGACNAGIQATTAGLVLLLNNDTIPQHGSFDHMVERIRSDPSIAIVGAKLVYLDQTLQEAGAVVWNEGSGANVGKGGDPADPRYDYPREVDYCSGAALLIRRDLLDLTGGFDPRFAPAYYEDTDLCFEARRHGYRVVYEPRARVVHLEGQTHGVSVDSGGKQYQARNRGVFEDKWRDDLAHHYPPWPRYEALAKTRTATRRMLVVDHTVPTYDRDGGSMRMLRLLRILRATGTAVWFCPMDRMLRQPYTRTLLDLGVEVVSATEDLPSLIRDLAPELDAAIISRRGVAWGMVDMLREQAPATPIVFDTVDLHFVREEAEAASEAAHDQLQAGRGRRMELALVGVCDQTWVVSEEEQRLLHKLMPDADVRVVTNVHDATVTDASFDERRDLLFVGNFHHPPNVDSLRWAVEELMPMIHRELPEVRLHVIGQGLPDDLRSTLGAGYVVHGWVEDLQPAYAQARLAFAPLRYGAGMKGKVAEALAMGVPVVTTPTGTEGMPDAVRELAVEAVSPREIADQAIALYNDARRWQRIHDAAPQVVAAAFGDSRVRAQVDEALGALSAPRP